MVKPPAPPQAQPPPSSYVRAQRARQAEVKSRAETASASSTKSATTKARSTNLGRPSFDEFNWDGVSMVDQILLKVVLLFDWYIGYGSILASGFWLFIIPVPSYWVGVIYLVIRRMMLKRYNLYMPGGRKYPNLGNHILTPENSGQNQLPFIRNTVQVLQEEANALLDTPPPQLVAQRILAQPPGQPAKTYGHQFNLLGGAWIQLQIHDWIDHTLSDKVGKLDQGEKYGCPMKKFRFHTTEEPPLLDPGTGKCPAGYYGPNNDKAQLVYHKNRCTAWWDLSGLYGNSEAAVLDTRTDRATGKIIPSGKIIETVDEFLALAANPIPVPAGLNPPPKGPYRPTVTGDSTNPFLGEQLLMTLLTKEHNQVCDLLAERYPDKDGEWLFMKARKIMSAIQNKIHTIDWTVELLRTWNLQTGMFANWYGLLGKGFKEVIPIHLGDTLSGIVGGPLDDTGDPLYSMMSFSEEFTTVYRLHPMLTPDIDYVTKEAVEEAQGRGLGWAKSTTKVPMLATFNAAGVDKVKGSAEKVMDWWCSFGGTPCGAAVPKNYGSVFRAIYPVTSDGSFATLPDDGSFAEIDLPALEIYRDRANGLPRYNAFRRNLYMWPCRTYAEVSEDPEIRQELASVYGFDADGNDNVDLVDTIVGLYCELSRGEAPKGFAISMTSFVLFIVMASRRLACNPDFTINYNEETYTKEGLDRIKQTDGLKTLIGRHYPELEALIKPKSAFTTWGYVEPRRLPQWLAPWQPRVTGYVTEPLDGEPPST